jgi:hypothetical protein
MPDDGVYLPLQVGSAGKETIPGFRRDDEGEHISDKNTSYCEMTGLYWAWKHLDADYIGLAHYRRHFAKPFAFGKKHRVAGAKTFESVFANTDVLLPKKRRYVLETNYSHYVHAHNEQDLLLTKQIVFERCPAYLPDWEVTMRKRSGHRFNMFVMKRELFVQYCSWVFGILFELERRLDVSAYTGLNARVFGLVSERLLDVWVTHNAISYAELPVVHLESQHWPEKIMRFLERKFQRTR